ncbi:hypothetical protein CDAR_165011 [Caerostris darwini]|uniref:Uncharacterized protein n=1 Tax=Caerostris darwini TaxID=1538125 RepID=A0AAV4NVD2_9ARAC|nr:hypothetical protein CDAR_165011 [Caerostris darwini]
MSGVILSMIGKPSLNFLPIGKLPQISALLKQEDTNVGYQIEDTKEDTLSLLSAFRNEFQPSSSKIIADILFIMKEFVYNFVHPNTGIISLAQKHKNTKCPI